jgi:hypothetical protein
MPRYFFHVVDNILPIEDDQGTAFAGPADALAHAETIAGDLALGNQYLGYAVVIVDEQDNLIARIPIIRRTN